MHLCITAAFLRIYAHENAQDGDVEGGSSLLPGLMLIESSKTSMDDIVVGCCEELVSVLRSSHY